MLGGIILANIITERNSSFLDLLNNIRQELACSYLKQPTLLVTVTDLSNFTRAFKQWTGTSPSDYRKNNF
ncbi:TPA: helix-turn-helix domain-containing protein [Acinetobacter baumannii]|uniref:helix-turn-helix domain-containing protein n=1 Tax=Acinetobacter calcoaceticus/baumannii complex TaxID=909768 RepID=UPI000BFA781B